MMTDAEAAFGITHNDHMHTESWRIEQVARIETGAVPNMRPPELTPDEADYMLRDSRLDSLKTVALVLFLVDVVLLVTAIVGA